MAFLLAFAAALCLAAGYFLGVRTGRRREQALNQTLQQRDEKLTLVEQELLRRSSLDPVTEVPTQQFFQEFLEREWRRAARERTSVSAVMIEVDGFRAYSDQLGKTEGDACLRAIAQAMKPIVHRPSDVLARYGAGKFAIVLGNTDEKGAMVIAERLRQAVEKLRRPNTASPGGSPFTLSIGIAAMAPDREGTWQDIELIAAAEKALIHARESGASRTSIEQTSNPTKTG